MDSLITAAARALAAGDPLGALQRVAVRDDAPAPRPLTQPEINYVELRPVGPDYRVAAFLRDAERRR
jgi:hypothetical protein